MHMLVSVSVNSLCVCILLWPCTSNVFAEKKSNAVSVKSNLKHNDDFMADGLNTLSSGAVVKGSVSNVAVFLCRADEKLLFLS